MTTWANLLSCSRMQVSCSLMTLAGTSHSSRPIQARLQRRRSKLMAATSACQESGSQRHFYQTLALIFWRLYNLPSQKELRSRKTISESAWVLEDHQLSLNRNFVRYLLALTQRSQPSNLFLCDVTTTLQSECATRMPHSSMEKALSTELIMPTPRWWARPTSCGRRSVPRWKNLRHIANKNSKKKSRG